MAEANGEGVAQANGHQAASPVSQQQQQQQQQQQSTTTTATATATAAATAGPPTAAGSAPALLPLSHSAPPPPPSNTTAAASYPAHPSVPLTSLADDGLAKRPRDARLIHMLLSSIGVAAYQERVPLQLLDFAYRHTSSVLADALHLSPDAYASQLQRSREPPAASGAGSRDADGQVNIGAVQLAVQSRLQYQFHGGGGGGSGGGGGTGGGTGGGGLSKEFLLETAEKRNAQALPRVPRDEWGVRLPSERFVLSGVPWSLKEAWQDADDDDDDDEDDDAEGGGAGGQNVGDIDHVMTYDAAGGEGGDEAEDGGGRMEDIFGEGGGDEMDVGEE